MRIATHRIRKAIRPTPRIGRRPRGSTLLGDLGQMLRPRARWRDAVGEGLSFLVLAVLVTPVTIISGGGDARVVADDLG